MQGVSKYLHNFGNKHTTGLMFVDFTWKTYSAFITGCKFAIQMYLKCVYTYVISEYSYSRNKILFSLRKAHDNLLWLTFSS